MPSDVDLVFKALADGTRRALLDQLHSRNGQPLRELCEATGMARQSTSQHLDILEAANLISTVHRGREKLHYINPVPIHAIQERWIEKFEEPRLHSLAAIKRQAEEAPSMVAKPSFIYVTYIESTPERIWQAITDADISGTYWGHSNVSDWKVGSRWSHVRTDGSGVSDGGGVIVESAPPRRLVFNWSAPGDDNPATATLVTFAIEPYGDIVRLTLTHENLTDEAHLADASGGWSAVLSNLKSFLETGHPLPQAPWEMPHS